MPLFARELGEIQVARLERRIETNRDKAKLEREQMARDALMGEHVALQRKAFCEIMIERGLAYFDETGRSLDPRVRQVVILVVGAVWKADYELYAHSAVARKAGLHDNTIAELAAGSPARDLTEAEQVAQRFTTELTASRRVDDALFNAAKEHFGLRGLVDLLSLIGAYQTVCGLLNGFAVPAPEG